ncbi:MgtC/SapB family protein [Sphingopyxis sp. JAI128]|uniref:MgtC/SapB family protein n=1 Tax=Sphingopyxis sp. JAI128 TaxID=2723066 RepID=UPI00161F86BA|nr:MgtC/SapB family protein [Sphingopyxis sp. JAI128]MBB6425348.1 putative Mg2+ transporter-C (MgtC) family protein [Sphingopyxis sp. JAI128]
MSELDLLDPDLLWPIAGAVLAGAIIGGEREYRASPAGLRTHILVALSCCLLMLSAVHQMEWLTDTPTDVVRIDPVRMAHGVLTGIGFLCGGVIFREGLNVRGLTTAASLWMTATLGILFGVGFYELAVFGGIATFLVLAAVTWTDRNAPQRRIAHVTLDYRAGTRIGSGEVRGLLAEHGLNAITVEQRRSGGAPGFTAIASGYGEARADALAAALSDDGRIASFDIRPQQG